MPRRLAIVGAGISGLAAAHTAAAAARESGEEFEVVVLERRGEVGGRASTLRRDGWLLEAGPSGYLEGDPEILSLVRAAGLEQERVVARAAAARRYIFQRGKLHEVGGNPLKPVFSGLLGPGALFRAAAEPFVPRYRGDGEESILAFVNRRFGRQIADRVVATAMLGIYAGDAGRLSVDACLPELRALEQEHGSVLRGLLRRRGKQGNTSPEGDAAGRQGPDGAASPPARSLGSFRHGMQRLPEALAAAPGIELELGVDVAQIEKTASDRPSAGAYLLLPTAGAPIWADAVILAGPTHVAARLLQRIAPAAANELSAIPVPPIVVVGLGFDPQGARGFPHGFGALVARGEGIRMLGFLLESHIYPGRCPADHLLVRCMFGGSMDPDVIDLDDDEVSSLAARELRALAGVSERPLLSHVVRWPRAIPQYELGHLARRDRIERELDRHPGLYLAGDALAGVSFPKAAAAGVHQARRAIEFLTPPITRTRS